MLPKSSVRVTLMPKATSTAVMMRVGLTTKRHRKRGVAGERGDHLQWVSASYLNLTLKTWMLRFRGESISEKSSQGPMKLDILLLTLIREKQSMSNGSAPNGLRLLR